MPELGRKGRAAVLVLLAAVLVVVWTIPHPDTWRWPSDGGGPATRPADRVVAPARVPDDYIWIGRERVKSLPMSGPAWKNVESAAERPATMPDLSEQDDQTNVAILAEALVFARTGEKTYRDSVVGACMMAMGTEGGRTLALGKELTAYVLAADLVGMPPGPDQRFREWLRRVRERRFPSGKTLISTHEDRPNNWGTYAGAARVAIAAYLGDRADLARAARVFKGWLGDRSAYSGFTFKDRAWQAAPNRPVGINPKGAAKYGHPIGGALPDDQRRGGGFVWPPPKENYVYSALQGALAQAVILHRAGYPVWKWEDEALRRAFAWLHEHADYPAEGDDTWQPHVINYYYGTDFPAPVPAEPGKNVGWTDWTHGPAARGTGG